MTAFAALVLVDHPTKTASSALFNSQFPSPKGLEKHKRQIEERRANLLGPKVLFHSAITAMLFTHYGLAGRWFALAGSVSAWGFVGGFFEAMKEAWDNRRAMTTTKTEGDLIAPTSGK
ncbi:hypothetical protein sscle_10g076160 [Sclerotinia sclerotiorum 1980 UF-70]|uniref:Uncharacterized protein n=1 Tax=Sclerotinia sclerotiorum (strain ATCC 18683 / 1980 / Ss-1) TaxID=665079 RepID=A0A1D9QD20_SCLS1|nr:hypothetical protein sscle_10g076160 [Sclerotinia sclerotiorum 1980 UF-70]